MAFEKVTRQRAKLRMALTGVSGSGKTLGALYIAYGMTQDWDKVALIDTEHERARFYANRADLGIEAFLYQPLRPPYSPERYVALVQEAAKMVGSDGVVIVDSLSHAWNSTGGVLEIKDQIAKRSSQSGFSAWNEAGKMQNGLINGILAADCHVIVTMRSKMDYALQMNDQGKQQPVKVGLAPVQRDDAEYEFDVVMNIDRSHVATASKDTTFLDQHSAVITPELGEQLAAWLNDGEEPPRCEVCGKVIRSNGTESVADWIEKSRKNTGKQMCIRCAKEWKAEQAKRAKGDPLDEAAERAARFRQAAEAACIEPDATYDFTCPLCGGTAQAGKASSNGHIHASCPGCGMTVME